MLRAADYRWHPATLIDRPHWTGPVFVLASLAVWSMKNNILSSLAMVMMMAMRMQCSPLMLDWNYCHCFYCSHTWTLLFLALLSMLHQEDGERERENRSEENDKQLKTGATLKRSVGAVYIMFTQKALCNYKEQHCEPVTHSDKQAISSRLFKYLMLHTHTHNWQQSN